VPAAATVSLDDVRAAAGRLRGVAHRTPVFTSRTLDDRADARILLKAENLQRGGAFKFRGAYNAIASLPEEQRERGVAAFSSGNHAQAVALAASLLGTRAVILMPTDAPATKLEATKGYGAEVVTYDRYGEDREALGAALAAEGRRVVGVEPEAGDDVRRSLEAGERVRIDVPKTIADGLQTTSPGAVPFAILQGRAEVVTVSDAELVDAMRFLFERLKLVVEPSGAAGVAALLAGRIDAPGARVGVVLSGGNVGAARFAELLSQPR
jgi:threo-3-hydroxy-L-aspartate ammonia-lyase